MQSFEAYLYKSIVTLSKDIHNSDVCLAAAAVLFPGWLPTRGAGHTEQAGRSVPPPALTLAHSTRGTRGNTATRSYRLQKSFKAGLTEPPRAGVFGRSRSRIFCPAPAPTPPRL